jgi:membrane protease YdiL (CAAX protease family)
MIAAEQRRILPPVLLAVLMILAAAAMFVLQTGIARIGIWAAGLFNYRAIDPDGAFLWISVHHIAQGLAALGLMLLLSRLFRLDFHLGMGKKRLGFAIVLWFTGLVFVYQFGMWFVLNALHLAKPFPYPVNARNLLGYFGFQLLLSGTSEELLFRALPITLLLMLSQGRISLFEGRVKLSLAVITAAVLFSIGHINWSTHPFRLSYDVSQLLYALLMGLVQGWAYEKAGSVVYPMMMHGISNVFVTAVSLVLPVFFH